MDNTDKIALIVFMIIMLILGLFVVIMLIGLILNLIFGWFSSFYDKRLPDYDVPTYSGGSSSYETSKPDTSAWDNNNINLMQNF